MEDNQYKLKYAAGVYWLVDTGQPGEPYRAPLRINEIGALIWGMRGHGKTREQMTEVLCAEYNAPKETIAEDVQTFLESMESYVAGRI